MCFLVTDYNCWNEWLIIHFLLHIMSLWLCSFGSWLCSCCLPLCPGIPSGKMGIFLAILLFVFSVMSLWWCCIDGEIFSCRSLPAVVQKLIQPKESCLLITLSSAVHPVNIWWIWKVGTTINSAYHSCYNYCGCYCQFMLLLLLLSLLKFTCPINITICICYCITYSLR